MPCSSVSGQPFSSLVLDEAMKVLHVSSILLLGFLVPYLKVPLCLLAQISITSNLPQVWFTITDTQVEDLVHRLVQLTIHDFVVFGEGHRDQRICMQHLNFNRWGTDGNRKGAKNIGIVHTVVLIDNYYFS